MKFLQNIFQILYFPKMQWKIDFMKFLIDPNPLKFDVSVDGLRKE